MSDVGDAFVNININTAEGTAQIEAFTGELDALGAKIESPKTLNVVTGKANTDLAVTQAKLNEIANPKEGSVTVNTSSAVTNLEELKAIEAEVAIPVEGSVILDTVGPVASVEALSGVLTIAAADIGALTTELTPVESGFAAAATAAQEMIAQLDATDVASANLLVDLIALVAAAEDAALALGSTTAGVAGLEAALAAVPAEAEAAAVGLEATTVAAEGAGVGLGAALGPIGLLAGAFGFLESVLSRAVTRIAVKETVTVITAIPAAFDPATAAVDKFKISANGLQKALSDLNTAFVGGLGNKQAFINELADLGLHVSDTANIISQFGPNSVPTFQQLQGSAATALESIKQQFGLGGLSAQQFQAIYSNAINQITDENGKLKNALTFGGNALFDSPTKTKEDALLKLTGLSKSNLDGATLAIRAFQDTAAGGHLDAIERNTINTALATDTLARSFLNASENQTGLNHETATGLDLIKLYVDFQARYASGIVNTGKAIDDILTPAATSGASAQILLNDGLRKNMDSLTQFDNALQARQGIDSLTLAPLAIPDFGALKAAFDGLDTPVTAVSEDLAHLKLRLDDLQNPVLDLKGAQAALTIFADGINKVGKGIDVNTVSGAKNVQTLTEGIGKAQAVASAALVANKGDAAAADFAYAASIRTLEAGYISAGGKAADFDSFLRTATATPAEYQLILSAASQDTVKGEIASIQATSPDIAATITPVVDDASAKRAQAQLDALKGIEPKVVKYDPTVEADKARGVDQQLVLLALSRNVALHPENEPEYLAKAKNDLDTIANAPYPATITVHPDLTLGTTAGDIQAVADANYKAVISADGDTADAQAKFRQIENTAYSAKISADAGGVPGAVQAALNSRSYDINIKPHVGSVILSAAGNHFQSFDRGGMPNIAAAPSQRVTATEASSQGPFYMWGEPSTRGEYFLSMDPQYKERNVGLWKQAGSELGVYAAAHSTPTGGHPDPASIAMLARVAAKMDKMITAAAAMPPITINTPITDPENHATKIHWSQRARLKSAGVL